MNVSVFSAQDFEQPFLHAAAGSRHQLRLLKMPLTTDTAHLAEGSAGVSVFSPDDVSEPVLEQLLAHGVRCVAVRAAGYDNVDLAAARQMGIQVANVPDYSPYAIAEHAVGLMLTLARHLRQADQQLRAHDFRLDQLIGFDLNGKTVGLLGVGRIGAVVARILHGFGCHLLGVDLQPNEELTRRYDLAYVPLAELCARADIISIHLPLTPATRYLVNDQLLGGLKPGAMLINTGRGGVLDTAATLRALASGRLGSLGLDVYEHEKGLFFRDHRQAPPRDETFAQLLACPNVHVTGHQAYLTREALTNIADATMASFDAWAAGRPAPHELTAGPNPAPAPTATRPRHVPVSAS